jgi:ABC-type uncharacterized transport system fused permease/ATPase subunit
MMNPDQRITEDVEKFCFAVSDLWVWLPAELVAALCHCAVLCCGRPSAAVAAPLLSRCG